VSKARVFLGGVFLLVVLGLAACGGGTSETSTSPATTAATEAPADTGTAAPADTGASDGGTAAASIEALDVRVITQTAVNQGTWDPQNYASYKAVADEMGWNLEIAEAVPYGEAEQVLTRWGNEGVDIVFSTDNGYQDSMLAAAAQFPDTDWVTMSDMSTTNDLPNVAAYTVDWCQLGFMQGVA